MRSFGIEHEEFRETNNTCDVDDDDEISSMEMFCKLSKCQLFFPIAGVHIRYE